MNQSQNGSLGVVNTSICQSCGRITETYDVADSEKKGGLTYAIIGWLFAAISFVFIPILFGAVALCMGFMTYTERSKSHGVALIVFAAMGLILGSLVSIVVAGTIFI